MSNYHRIRCWSCDEDCEAPSLNHGGAALALVLHNLDAALDLGDALDSFDYRFLEVTITVDGQWIAWDWLREHRAHLLFVRDEYNEELSSASYVRTRPGPVPALLAAGKLRVP